MVKQIITENLHNQCFLLGDNLSKLKEKNKTESKEGSGYGKIILAIVLVGVLGLLVFGGPVTGFYLLGNPFSDAPTGNNGRPFKGTADAKIIVIEYSDFQCPACSAAHDSAKNIINEFSDSVRFEYRHFPLSSIHPFAFKAAVAAEVAADQGKFWEYHDLLFANQNNLKRDDLIKYAEQLGLDIEKFTATLDSNEKDALIQADLAEGQKAGVGGTPTFFVNGKKLDNWGQLKEAIQAELKK